MLCLQALRNSRVKNIAELAKERKYFAIRFRMRSGKVSRRDLTSTFEGKTVEQWLRAANIHIKFLNPTTTTSYRVTEPMTVLAELTFLMVSIRVGIICF